MKTWEELNPEERKAVIKLFDELSEIFGVYIQGLVTELEKVAQIMWNLYESLPEAIKKELE